MVKYYENALDRIIRLAREDEAKKVTDQVTEKVACNLLRDNHDVKYVHEITGLSISRINELKANL
ncbi:hypothetical protein [Methanobrevibacter sp.]